MPPRCEEKNNGGANATQVTANPSSTEPEYADVYGDGEEGRFEHINISGARQRWAASAPQDDSDGSDVQASEQPIATQSAGAGYWLSVLSRTVQTLQQMCDGTGADTERRGPAGSGGAGRLLPQWTPEQALRAGEVLYVLRPLVYVLVLQHFEAGREEGDEATTERKSGFGHVPSGAGPSQNGTAATASLLDNVSLSFLSKAFALAVSLVSVSLVIYPDAILSV